MSDAVLQHFGLTGRERADRQVNCPFHEDTNASASVNVKKRLLNCFACGRGWTFEQVAEKLGVSGETSPSDDSETTSSPSEGAAPPPPPAPRSEDALLELAEEHIRSRGYDIDEFEGYVDWAVETDPEEKLYGYLVLVTRGGMSVARNLLDDERPKYLNPKGGKSIFWITDPPAGSEPAWICEGVWDAVALASLGVGAVGATLGVGLSDPQAFALRGRTVFVVFDADAAGYRGAREAKKVLEEFGARPLVLDMPGGLGKDPGEAFASAKPGLLAWLDQVRADMGTTDEQYVRRTLRGEGSLIVVPTGHAEWDRILGGGFKTGAHTIAGETGIGKTALVTDLAVSAADAGLRVQLHTYEISKRQQWARLASTGGEYEWSALEQNPQLLEGEAAQYMMRLSERIKVCNGWGIPKIEHTSHGFDVIIVDYIQRMPGPFGENESRQNVKHCISRLSDLARDQNKVIVVVSSMPRQSYGKVSLAGLKESGEIEYVSQSVTMFLAAGGGGGSILAGHVVKNTRGQKGNFWLRTDLGHCGFAESRPPGRAVA